MIIFFIILYVALAGFYIYLQGERVRGHAIIKAAPIFLLILPMLFPVSFLAETQWYILAALVFSAAGDIFLALDDDGNYFVPGLGSFLIAHIFYTIAFAQSAAFQPLSLIPILVILTLGVFVTWRIWDGLDNLKIPVVLYILVSMVMGFSAAVHAPISWTLIAGSIIFMLSDSVIALDKFSPSMPYQDIRDTIVMTTYYTAQFMIWIGIVLQA